MICIPTWLVGLVLGVSVLILALACVRADKVLRDLWDDRVP